MSTSLRFGSALSVIAVATMVGGCANFGGKARSSFGSVDMANVALGTRAQAALAKQDFGSAVDLAEKAVEKSPEDAGFRTLLGNAYFGAGRFASAEAAYRDSLSLYPSQPQVALKLALVQIAQGKTGQAVALLNSARTLLGASDYGLALALAGETAAAVDVLGSAAREPGADAQLRQNLALAHALAGDWTSARIIAAQDLSPDLVDARLQQWMAFASPVKASDQVAGLLGVTPATGDPGQPVRLALRDGDSRMAAAETPIPSAPIAAPQPALTQAEPAQQLAAVEFPQPQTPALALAPALGANPELVSHPAPEPRFEAPTPMPVLAASAPSPARSEAPILASADKSPKRSPVRKAMLERPVGKSSAVVQLGAYSTPDRVSIAWDRLTERYPALKGYTPMRARFDGPNGTVWRLSIRGFAEERDAIERCDLLKSRGGSCFVRKSAGDAPVQFASR